jgi:hypothetical protein
MDERTLRELIVGSARRHQYGDAAALAQSLDTLDPAEMGRLRARCRFGQRLLRLDLADLELSDDIDLARHLDADLAETARTSTFPALPGDRARGWLGDISTALGHLLAALDIRWERGEVLHVMALVHLAGEYLGHLAWTDVLGHSADPVELRGELGGRGSSWGDLDADECGHNRAHRHLAEDLQLGEHLVSPEAWQRFLRDRYSQVGELLLTCATRTGTRVWGRSPRDCRAECTVWSRRSEAVQRELQRRVMIAHWFRRSPLVRQRHASPIGHFFGVPEAGEIVEAFDDLVARLHRAQLVDVGPGTPAERLSVICTEIAGKPVRATTLLAEVAARIEQSLTPAV